jgi:hypothetical protein
VRGGLVCAVLLGCGRIGFLPSGGDANTGDGNVPGDLIPDAPTCPAFALLCDDFESGSLTTHWTRVDTAQGGTATITSTNPHTGSRSLEVDCPAQATPDAQAAPTLRIAPQTTGVLAVREWINSTTQMQHFDLVAQLETFPSQYSSAGGNDFGYWVSTELDPPPINMGPDHTSTPNVATPAPGTWTCVELVYTFAGAAGNAQIQIFVNETAVVDAPANKTNGASYNDIAIGVNRADSAGFHLFVDDVVIAQQRIHCN